MPIGRAPGETSFGNFQVFDVLRRHIQAASAGGAMSARRPRIAAGARPRRGTNAGWSINEARFLGPRRYELAPADACRRAGSANAGSALDSAQERRFENGKLGGW